MADSPMSIPMTAITPPRPTHDFVLPVNRPGHIRVTLYSPIEAPEARRRVTGGAETVTSDEGWLAVISEPTPGMIAAFKVTRLDA